MPTAIPNTGPDQAQRTYARLAGVLFLGVILLALGSGFVLSGISGSGPFAETARRIAAAERLYRVGLSAALLVSFGGVALAFALYQTLKSVNAALAQLAMIFSLADAFLALFVRTSGFVRVPLYISASTEAVNAEAFVGLLRNVSGTAENIGGVCFGIGSFFFFYLFLKSGLIPKALSVLGLAAAGIWTALYFANLIFPAQHDVFMSVCFPPMALADVGTGAYLMLFAVKAN